MSNGKIITGCNKSSFDIWDGFRPIRQVWFSLSRASGHFVSCFVSGIIANDSHLRGDTMLNIYFGDMPEAVYNTSVYFNYTYEDEWLTSDFAKEVIKKIDKSDVKGPHAVESPVLGVISPEKLSGGTKTLLLMANDPEKVFNASTCGDNCAPFILKLAKKKDLTINLRHLMDFGKKKFPVDVKVLNTGDVVHSMEELMPIAFQFV